jgi:hypothetical protein
MRRLVLALTLALVMLAVYTIERSGQPDARLTGLAVRATVFALPSPSPLIVEVTRVVEVTRIVEVTRLVEVNPPPPTATLTPTITPAPTSDSAVPSLPEPVAQAAALSAQTAPARQELSENVAFAPVPDSAEPVPEVTLEVRDAGSCPATSAHQYTAVPVNGPRTDRPDGEHGDLNLALRGYVPVDAGLSLIDIDGPTDADPPQVARMFGDSRLPAFTRGYRVRDWNWTCGGHGCRGDELHHVEISLLAVQTTPGEAISIPARGAEIYGGGYAALVLYADPARVTLVYTREDTVASGYAVHIEELCVDANLLALYQASNTGGRGSLPALRNGELVGTARHNQLLVAIRDRGAFTDPRSRKDWWRGY